MTWPQLCAYARVQQSIGGSPKSVAYGLLALQPDAKEWRGNPFSSNKVWNSKEKKKKTEPRSN